LHADAESAIAMAIALDAIRLIFSRCRIMS